MKSFVAATIILHLSMVLTLQPGSKTEKVFFKILKKSKFVDPSIKQSEFYKISDNDKGVLPEVMVSVPLEFKYAVKKESEYAPLIKLSGPSIVRALNNFSIPANSIKKAYFTTEVKGIIFMVHCHCVGVSSAVADTKQLVASGSSASSSKLATTGSSTSSAILATTSSAKTPLNLPITAQIFYEGLRNAKIIDPSITAEQFYLVSEIETSVQPRVRFSFEIELEYASFGDPQFVPTILRQLGAIVKSFASVPKYGLMKAYITQEIIANQFFLHFNCIVTSTKEPIYVTFHINSAEREKPKSKKSGPKFEEACKTLGVGPESTLQEVEKSYRSLAMKHHPDRHATETPEVQAKHEEIFKKILAAYQYLQEE